MSFDLQNFFSYPIDLLCVVNKKGFFYHLNPAWATFSGFGIDELRARPVLDFIHEADRKRAAEAFKKDFGDEFKSKPYLNRFVCQDGSWRWLEWKGKCQGDFWYCSVRDVTREKENRLFLDQIQSAGKIGGWRIVVQGMKTQWSEETYRIFELPVGSSADLHTGFGLCPPEAQPVISRSVADCIASGKEFDVELPFLTALGNRKWVRAKGYPLFEGNRVAEVYGSFQDISERMSLSRNNEILLFSSDLGLWDWDLTSNKVFYDQRWCEMIGYRPDELDQHLSTWESLCHPEDKVGAQRAFSAYLTGASSFYEVKIRMKHKIGHWVPVLSKGKVTSRDPQGKPLQFSGAHVDFTNFQKMEDRLVIQQAIATESSRLAQIGEVASNVGHEVNNPLTIVLFHLEKMEKILGLGLSALDELGHGQLKESLQKQKSAATRIRDIVATLRMISRRPTAIEGPADLLEVVESSVSLLEEIFETGGVTIKLDLPIEACWVDASSEQLQQVLTNLLTNARDALESSPFKEILVRVQASAEGFSLIVEDAGCGIPPEIHDRILEPFFTTKEVGKGTGLGLAIAASMVREMKGRISFESHLGRGTQFKVLLSESNAKPVPRLDQALDERTTKTEEISKRKVLIVDDEKEIRFLLRDLLHDSGYQVVLTSNGKEALQELRTSSFDVIVTDIKMPVMNGLQLVEEIHRNRLAPLARIYVMTGGADLKAENLEAQKLKEGIDGFLFKPFDHKKVLETLSLL